MDTSRTLDYAAWIEQMRRERRWRKKELAHYANLSERLLRLIRAGAKVTRETNAKLAAAFNLDAADMYRRYQASVGVGNLPHRAGSDGAQASEDPAPATVRTRASRPK